MYKDKCIVINFISGPGVGKSIIAAEIFARLKREFVSVEISPEYIKNKIREGSKKAIQSQVYIFGNQQYQLFYMKDEVDVIVTDSPLILSTIYDVTKCEELKNLVIKEFNKYNNVVYYIERDMSVPYEKEGRFEDSDEARKVDNLVKGFLEDNNINYTVVNGIGEDTINLVVNETLERLNGKE